ncbi:MAG: 2-hydroxyacid dehydrogenase [Opitutales bacterium]|nr:2-hydroxyacid dehydrogenase [Opitutales bacterium]
MKVAVFSTKPYDRRFLEEANKEHGHDLHFYETRLNEETARLAEGHEAVTVFVNDDCREPVLKLLQDGGTRCLALRSAGFNHVDLAAALKMGFTVNRVPAYSPHAVAEHTLALCLGLNRQLHRAFNRVREGNFALDGLLGFDLHGKTVGIVGTGKIGAIVAHTFRGFGCKVLAYDVHKNPDCEKEGVEYLPLDELLPRAEVLSLHCPLTPDTKHLINQDSLKKMKMGAMLINTSRGALVETKAVVEALKTGRLGALGLDVYEEEGDLFFEDLSNKVIQDDVFMRLLTFPNVLITGHQAFFTKEALQNITSTTLGNISAFARGETNGNELSEEFLANG